MKPLVIYTLETPKREQLATDVKSVINQWLVNKGVPRPDDSTGIFKSKTKNETGKFKQRTITSEKGVLHQLVLSEPTHDGNIFTTSIAAIDCNETYTIHASLSVHSNSARIAPMRAQARCPAVIRTIIEKFPNWNIGNKPVMSPIPIKISSKQQIELIVNEIHDKSRTIPIIIVSENEGEPIWPKIAEIIHSDLIGLAWVYQISTELAWILTEEIGKRNSCYKGAIRIYWPHGQSLSKGDFLRIKTWTARDLLEEDDSGEKFRNTIREIIMDAAAEGIATPRKIFEIVNSDAERAIQELKKRTDINSEQIEIANFCIEESRQLKEELEAAQAEISSLKYELESCKYRLQQKGDSKDDDSSSDDDACDPASPAIKSGDISFYKKTHSTPNHDILVSVKSCSHNRWQSAEKGEKAMKGIKKLTGRDDWRKIQHCGSCTGGGMWKVEW